MKNEFLFTKRKLELHIPNLEDYIKSIMIAEKAALGGQGEASDEWMTSVEAMRYLKVSKATLWGLCKKGVVTRYYLNGIPRFKKSDLDSKLIKEVK